MKISKALSRKKSAQNSLSRLIALRKRNLYYDKSKNPEFGFDEIEKQIESKIKCIDDLKMKILYTNCHTQLDNGVLLQEAIIRLGNIRSELSCYNSLLEKEPGDRLLYFRGNAEIKEYVPQVDKRHIMKKIEELEAEKYELDALIANANNSTELIEEFV